jgi:hypothetical protein
MAKGPAQMMQYLAQNLTQNELVALVMVGGAVGAVCTIAAVLGLATRVFRLFAGLTK